MLRPRGWQRGFTKHEPEGVGVGVLVILVLVLVLVVVQAETEVGTSIGTTMVV